MAHLDIPFSPEMAAAALMGAKTKTSRNKRYGQLGDIFNISGHINGRPVIKLFELVSIEEHPLSMVAQVFYQDEGFVTPEAFIQTWNKLHPKKKFQPDHIVYVHTFEKVQ